MMCTAIAILLLALTGGMFLLAKTDKDNLGAFYKVVSWFVIVLATLCLLCCLFRCVMGKCGKKQQKGQCTEMVMSSCSHKKMMNDGCQMNCEKKCCSYKECDADEKKSCKEGGAMQHCKMGDKKEIVKDSVTIKK